MAINYMRLVLRAVLTLVMGVGLVAGSMIIVPRWRQWKQLTRRRGEVEAEIVACQLEIDGIRRRQVRFQSDPTFVERLARENRRVRPGEIVFIFDQLEDEP